MPRYKKKSRLSLYLKKQQKRKSHSDNNNSMVSKKTRERVSTKVKDVKVAKHGIRRQSRADVELLMECMDDELSPAQLKAIDLAYEEHEKANNLIKAARAGNTLVPSSQPNTFTIVPHKPVQAPPPKQLATPPQQQTIPTSLLTPPSKAAQMQETPTRGLPPPRPVQFMNKHQAKQSPEVILIPDNEAPAPVSRPQQQVPPLTLMSSPPGVTPQQVYKFVSLPGNQPATTIGPNQWVIRPLQTVPPQQQGMMSQLSPTGQQMMAFNMMARTPNNQPVARQPHPGVDGRVIGNDGRSLKSRRSHIRKTRRSQYRIHKSGRSLHAKHTQSTSKTAGDLSNSLTRMANVRYPVLSKQKMLHMMGLNTMFGKNKMAASAWSHVYNKRWFLKAQKKAARWNQSKQKQTLQDKKVACHELEQLGPINKTINKIINNDCDTIYMDNLASDFVDNTSSIAKAIDLDAVCDTVMDVTSNSDLRNLCDQEVLRYTVEQQSTNEIFLDDRNGLLNQPISNEEQCLVELAKRAISPIDCLSSGFFTEDHRGMDDLGLSDNSSKDDLSPTGSCTHFGPFKHSILLSTSTSSSFQSFDSSSESENEFSKNGLENEDPFQRNVDSAFHPVNHENTFESQFLNFTKKRLNSQETKSSHHDKTTFESKFISFTKERESEVRNDIMECDKENEKEIVDLKADEKEKGVDLNGNVNEKIAKHFCSRQANYSRNVRDKQKQSDCYKDKESKIILRDIKKVTEGSNIHNKLMVVQKKEPCFIKESVCTKRTLLDEADFIFNGIQIANTRQDIVVQRVELETFKNGGVCNRKVEKMMDCSISEKLDLDLKQRTDCTSLEKCQGADNSLSKMENLDIKNDITEPSAAEQIGSIKKGRQVKYDLNNKRESDTEEIVTKCDIEGVDTVRTVEHSENISANNIQEITRNLNKRTENGYVEMVGNDKERIGAINKEDNGEWLDCRSESDRDADISETDLKDGVEINKGLLIKSLANSGQLSRKNWSDDLSLDDICHIVMLSRKYGATKISKVLHIPKSQVLRWRRRIKGESGRSCKSRRGQSRDQVKHENVVENDAVCAIRMESDYRQSKEDLFNTVNVGFHCYTDTVSNQISCENLEQSQLQSIQDQLNQTNVWKVDIDTSNKRSFDTETEYLETNNTEEIDVLKDPEKVQNDQETLENESDTIIEGFDGWIINNEKMTEDIVPINSSLEKVADNEPGYADNVKSENFENDHDYSLKSKTDKVNVQSNLRQSNAVPQDHRKVPNMIVVNTKNLEIFTKIKQNCSNPSDAIIDIKQDNSDTESEDESSRLVIDCDSDGEDTDAYGEGIDNDDSINSFQPKAYSLSKSHHENGRDKIRSTSEHSLAKSLHDNGNEITSLNSDEFQLVKNKSRATSSENVAEKQKETNMELTIVSPLDLTSDSDHCYCKPSSSENGLLTGTIKDTIDQSNKDASENCEYSYNPSVAWTLPDVSNQLTFPFKECGTVEGRKLQFFKTIDHVPKKQADSIMKAYNKRGVDYLSQKLGFPSSCVIKFVRKLGVKWCPAQTNKQKKNESSLLAKKIAKKYDKQSTNEVSAKKLSRKRVGTFVSLSEMSNVLDMHKDINEHRRETQDNQCVLNECKEPSATETEDLYVTVVKETDSTPMYIAVPIKPGQCMEDPSESRVTSNTADTIATSLITVATPAVTNTNSTETMVTTSTHTFSTLEDAIVPQHDEDQEETLSLKDDLFKERTEVSEVKLSWIEKRKLIKEQGISFKDIMEAEKKQFGKPHDIVKLISKRTKYSTEFKKRMINLMKIIPTTTLCAYYGLNISSMYLWEKNLKEDNGKTGKDTEKTKDPEKTKNASKAKRNSYSNSLKVKLVHLSKKCGRKSVVEQYGLSKSTFNLWSQKFKDEKLPSYELTEEDLLHLVENNENRLHHNEKLNVTQGVALQTADVIEIKELQTNTSQLNYQEDIEISGMFQEDSTKEDKLKEYSEATAMGDVIVSEKATLDNETHTKIKRNTNSSNYLAETPIRQMTFPNNLEIVLGEGDEIDEEADDYNSDPEQSDNKEVDGAEIINETEQSNTDQDLPFPAKNKSNSGPVEVIDLTECDSEDESLAIDEPDTLHRILLPLEIKKEPVDDFYKMEDDLTFTKKVKNNKENKNNAKATPSKGNDSTDLLRDKDNMNKDGPVIDSGSESTASGKGVESGNDETGTCGPGVADVASIPINTAGLGTNNNQGTTQQSQGGNSNQSGSSNYSNTGTNSGSYSSNSYSGSNMSDRTSTGLQVQSSQSGQVIHLIPDSRPGGNMYIVGTSPLGNLNYPLLAQSLTASGNQGVSIPGIPVVVSSSSEGQMTGVVASHPSASTGNTSTPQVIQIRNNFTQSLLKNQTSNNLETANSSINYRPISPRRNLTPPAANLVTVDQQQQLKHYPYGQLGQVLVRTEPPQQQRSPESLVLPPLPKLTMHLNTGINRTRQLQSPVLSSNITRNESPNIQSSPEAETSVRAPTIEIPEQAASKTQLIEIGAKDIPESVEVTTESIVRVPRVEITDSAVQQTPKIDMEPSVSPGSIVRVSRIKVTDQAVHKTPIIEMEPNNSSGYVTVPQHFADDGSSLTKHYAIPTQSFTTDKAASMDGPPVRKINKYYKLGPSGVPVLFKVVEENPTSASNLSANKSVADSTLKSLINTAADRIQSKHLQTDKKDEAVANKTVADKKDEAVANKAVADSTLQSLINTVTDRLQSKNSQQTDKKDEAVSISPSTSQWQSYGQGRIDNLIQSVSNRIKPKATWQPLNTLPIQDSKAMVIKDFSSDSDIKKSPIKSNKERILLMREQKIEQIDSARKAERAKLINSVRTADQSIKSSLVKGSAVCCDGEPETSHPSAYHVKPLVSIWGGIKGQVDHISGFSKRLSGIGTLSNNSGFKTGVAIDPTEKKTNKELIKHLTINNSDQPITLIHKDTLPDKNMTRKLSVNSSDGTTIARQKDTKTTENKNDEKLIRESSFDSESTKSGDETESADLTEKLKSLLNADIFNVIESDKESSTDNDADDNDDNSEEGSDDTSSDDEEQDSSSGESDDVEIESDDQETEHLTGSLAETINRLKKATKSKIKPGSESKVKKSKSMGKTRTDAKPNTTDVKFNRHKFSLSIKQKIGKIAATYNLSNTMMCSKYMVSPSAVGRWKREFKDVDISTEFTKSELKELKVIRDLAAINKNKKGKSDYDIYIDNPEPELEYCEDIEEESTTQLGNDKELTSNADIEIVSDTVEMKKYYTDEPSDTTVDGMNRSTKTRSLSGSSVTNADKVSDLGSNKLPFYLSVSDTVTEEFKEQLRQKMKASSQGTVKGLKDRQGLGVFSSSESPTKVPKPAGVFSSTQEKIPEISKTNEGVFSSSKEKVPYCKNILKGNSLNINTESGEQRSTKRPERTHKRSLSLDNDLSKDENIETGDQLTKTVGGIVCEKTAYLCPNDGTFKYKYAFDVSKTHASGQQSTSTNLMSSRNVLKTVLDTAASGDSKDKKETDTVVQQDHSYISPVKDKEAADSTSKPSTALMQHTNSGINTTKKDEAKASNPTPVSTDSGRYSYAFKAKVVQEAKKSGFENTAKWFDIPMTEIMKWHDAFFTDHPDKNFVATVVTHARKNGPDATSVVYPVTKSKIIEWMNAVNKKPDSTMANANVEIEIVNDMAQAETRVMPTEKPKVPPKQVLNFETYKIKEGSIMRPKFKSENAANQSSVAATSNMGPQKTRMGGNAIKYTPSTSILMDVQGDLGAMPRIVKQNTNKTDGVEIASTWKQVQSILNPAKPAERKYSQDFKNRIMKECEARGQKSVARENHIPYNEISRWRLEAKKTLASHKPGVVPAKKPAEAAKQASIVPTSGSSKDDSLKITIKLSSSKPAVVQKSTSSPLKSQSSKITSSKQTFNFNKPGPLSSKPGPLSSKPGPLSSKPGPLSSKPGPLSSKTGQLGSKQTPSFNKPGPLSSKPGPLSSKPGPLSSKPGPLSSKPGPLSSKTIAAKEQSTVIITEKLNKSEVPQPDAGTSNQSNTIPTGVDGSETRVIVVDADTDTRMEVINYCFQYGVLKTQKKFSVTRQSIIDLMQEYDELNKFAVDAYNREHGFKTKLVSRDKTSVEVTNTGEPILVNNLQDYIVTPEYQESVVDYAREHGITAATRKFKRKTSTVKSWMAHQEKSERRQKKINLGFTQPIFGQATKDEVKNITAENVPVLVSQSPSRLVNAESLNVSLSPISPRRRSLSSDSSLQKSPQSKKHKTPPPSSPIWAQDFVIKPSTGKSPLKLTLSPRGKSPVINIMDDETNDIETEDEVDDLDLNDGEFVEFASWDPTAETKQKETDSNKADTEMAEAKAEVEVIDLLSDTDQTDRGSVIDIMSSPEKRGSVIDIMSSPEKGTTKMTSPQKKINVFSPKKSESANEDETIPEIEIDTDDTNIEEAHEENINDKKEDTFISPFDVPNIFEIEDFDNEENSDAEKPDDVDTTTLVMEKDTPSNTDMPLTVESDMDIQSNEGLNASENIEKDMVQSKQSQIEIDVDGTSKDMEPNVLNKQAEEINNDAEGVGNQQKEKEDTISKAEKEDLVKIPYEETVMFKLLTEDVDKFFKDETKIIPKIKKTKSVSEENNLNTKKRRCRGADFEIMQNLGENCIFAPSRHRNAAEIVEPIKEAVKDSIKETFKEDNDNVESKLENESVLDSKEKNDTADTNTVGEETEPIDSEAKETNDMTDSITDNQEGKADDSSLTAIDACKINNKTTDEGKANDSGLTTKDACEIDNKITVKDKANVSSMIKADTMEHNDHNAEDTKSNERSLFDFFITTEEVTKEKDMVDNGSNEEFSTNEDIIDERPLINEEKPKEHIENNIETETIASPDQSSKRVLGLFSVLGDFNDKDKTAEKEKEVVEDKKDNKPVNEEVKSVVEKSTTAKSSKADASFSLFGNLMKSFKLPVSLAVDSTDKVKTAKALPEPIVTESINEILSEQEKEKPDNITPEESKPDLDDVKFKDRSERNVFDFMLPEPSVTASPTKPLFKMPDPVSTERSPIKGSPIKMAPLSLGGKKPMFKFPKLSVNFGNIAKLGIEKLKQAEKLKVEKPLEELKPTSKMDIEEAKSEVEALKPKERVKEQCSAIVEDKKELIQPGVVMETFEQLRQRLIRERAAAKQKREKTPEVIKILPKSDEIDGEKVVKVQDTTKNHEKDLNKEKQETSEIDYEMYKDFTPQKIVLILDISKKHGIEFASSSFGLPVSAIINWIIEKDRKHRKMATAVCLEKKLQALKDLKENSDNEVQEVAAKHEVEVTVLMTWEQDIGWLIEQKGVCEVIDKWQKVQSVSNLCLDELAKSPLKDVKKHRDSVRAERSISQDEMKVEMPITSEKMHNEEKMTVEEPSISTMEQSCSTDLNNASSVNNEIQISNDDRIMNTESNTLLGLDETMEQLNTDQTNSNTEQDISEHTTKEVVSDVTASETCESSSIEDKTVLSEKQEQESIPVDMADTNDKETVTENTTKQSETTPEETNIPITQEDAVKSVDKQKLFLSTDKEQLDTENSLQSTKVQDKDLTTETDETLSDVQKHQETVSRESADSDVELVRVELGQERNDDAVTQPNKKENEMNELTNEVVEKDVTENKVTDADSHKGKTDADISETPDKESETASSIPGVLSFIKDLHSKDYSVEQKAMIVVLINKYGIKEAHNKLGIHKGTLWKWKYQNRSVKNFLNEQTSSSKRKTPQNSPKEKSISPNMPSTNVKPVLRSQSGERKPVETVPKETSYPPKEAKPGVSKSQHVKDILDQPKGYRNISPTKIPEILLSARKIPTKNYSLEQRVAIVKLVELYGVRTIHKQFRIPSGSIWNWQHNKQVMEQIKADRSVKDGSSSPASRVKKNLQFDNKPAEESRPLTIDLLLDRVLVSIETTNHLGFKLEQKADVVCLVNQFGMNYVCELIPQIPRGTIWHWVRNKNVAAVVEKNNSKLRSQAETRASSVHKETKASSVVSTKDKGGEDRDKGRDEIDKVGLTQQWLNALQDTRSGSKRKHPGSSRSRHGSLKKLKGARSLSADRAGKKAFTETDGHASDNSEYSNKSNQEFYEEVGMESEDELCSSVGLKSRSSIGNYGNISLRSRPRSQSPSTISSAISEHSNDFEEIISEDETNPPSVYSRRSETSLQASQSSRNSKSTYQKAGKQVAGLVSSKQTTCVVSAAEKEEVVEPVHEILKFESMSDDRMMVCYKVLNQQGVSGSEITKTPPAAYKTNMEKKTAAKRDEQTSGNWQPLDEYYYGTVEGDSKYTEEKGEFMFKCWYCSKMLYNNVRAMQHIQGHIDSSKQQNIDLSDLTQCKHCYKQFDTPFDMQTHVEKIHLSNKVLMCRICEKDMASTRDLTNHMKQNHKACEMPYVCQLCNFRSSMYSDVVDHFKKKHDSSNSLLCLYCLRTFSVKFVSQGWGQTQTYYGHLLKHQSKSTAKKCVVCRLTFFNANDVKTHRKTHHVSTNRGGSGVGVCHSPIFRDIGERKGGHLKSLNAPSISKIQDYGGVKLPAKTSTSFCFECKMTMSSTDHYKKYINCSLCRFATMCSVAYANHMMGFHSGQMTSLNLNIPWERPMDTVMYCSCGFSTKYGNKIATHLVFCVKQTCYTKENKVNVTGGGAIKTGTSDDDGSLLGMLGLVQKKAKPTPDVIQPEASTSDDRPRKKPGPKSKRGRPRSITPEAKDITDTKPIIKVSVTKVVLTDIKITKDQSTISESEPVKSAVVGEPVKIDDDDSKIEDQSMEVDTKEMETTDHKLDENETESEENVADTEKMAESETNVNTETKGATEGEIAIKDGEVTQSESDSKSQLADDQPMEDEILEENNTETDTVDKETEEMLLSDATDKIVEENATEAEQIDKTEENEAGEKMEDVTENVPVIDEKLPVEDKDDETMETETAVIEDLDTMETEPSVSGEKDECQSSNSDVVDQAKEIEGKTAKDLEILTEEADTEKEKEAVVEEDQGEANDDSQDMADNIQEEEERTEEKTESKEEVAVENVAKESDKEIQQDAETEDTIDEEKTEQSEKDPTEESKEEEQKTKEEQIEEEEKSETEEKDKIEDKSKLSEKETTEEKTADDGEKSEKKEDDKKKDETPERGSRDEHRHDDHTDKHRSDHYRHGDTHSSSSSHRDDRSRDYDRHRHDDRSHDDRYRRDDRSHGSYRSDSHHSSKPYDRNRDNRDRYDRDRGDNRSGYSSHGGHQDYRGQGQSGHHGGQQGQYGGNRGNRGGYNNNRDQDRGNRGNRGGYNQGYRGGYQGGGGYY